MNVWRAVLTFVLVVAMLCVILIRVSPQSTINTYVVQPWHNYNNRNLKSSMDSIDAPINGTHSQHLPQALIIGAMKCGTTTFTLRKPPHLSL